MQDDPEEEAEDRQPQPLAQMVDDPTENEGVHLLFCGHQIHMECFDRYFSSLVKSHIDVRLIFPLALSLKHNFRETNTRVTTLST